MRVAIVCRHLPPVIDAVGAYALQLARALARRGTAVTLVSSSNQPALPEKEPLIELYPVVRSWGWSGVLRMVLLFRKLRADAVYYQFVPHMYGRYGIAFPAACLPLLLRMGAGKRVVTTCHELLSYNPKDLRNRLLQQVYRLQAALILRGSDRLVVPTEWQELLLRRYFPRSAARIRTIPVGSNIPAPDAVSRPSPPTHRASDTAQVTLGTFGTGHPWWQYERVLRILRGLRDQGLPVGLLCIGDIVGNNPERYRGLLKLEEQLGLTGSVRWSGIRTPEEISRLLQSVDLFLALQDSGITARSTALMAALAHGLPVVATRGPMADRWLVESGALQVVDSEETESALSAIAQLVREPERRRDLGRRARDLYERHLAWDILADQLLRLLQTADPA